MSANLAPAPVLMDAYNKQPQTKQELFIELLFKENQALKKENAELKHSLRKRKADDPAIDPPIPKIAKTPAQRKKLFEAWVTTATYGSAQTKIPSENSHLVPYKVGLTDTNHWSAAEFEAIFCAGTGVVVTETFSPTTIVRFDSYEEIKKLFGRTKIPEVGYTYQCMKGNYKQKDFPAFLEGLEVYYYKDQYTLKLCFGFKTGNYMSQYETMLGRKP